MTTVLDTLREDLATIVAAADGDEPAIVLSRVEAAELLHELEQHADEFEGWADVELMGHRRRIAYVRPVELARRGFLELTGTRLGVDFRELYAPSAVFCLVPIDEAQARELQASADQLRAAA